MVLKEIHYWIETVLPLISIVLNVLLLYLIKKFTTKEMKPYSIILLQECLINLFLASGMLLTKQLYSPEKARSEMYKVVRWGPVRSTFSSKFYYFLYWLTGLSCLGVVWGPQIMEIQDRMLIIIIMGYFSSENFWLNFIIYQSVMLLDFSSYTLLPISFFCRYMTICKGKHLSNKLYAILYTCGGLIGFGFLFLDSWLVFPGKTFEIESEAIVRKSYWANSDGTLPMILYTKFENPILWAAAFYNSMGAVISYSSIIYFSWKIKRHLSMSNNFMHTKVFRAQQQLNYILFVQAACPLLSIMPITIAVMLIIFNTELLGLDIIASSLISLVTVLNPICTIFVVKPYREKILMKKNANFSIEISKTHAQVLKPNVQFVL